MRLRSGRRLSLGKAATVTLCRSQSQLSSHTVVPVCGWGDHNADSESRAKNPKLRSPEDVALLDTILRTSLGRTNMEIQVLRYGAVVAPLICCQLSNKFFQEIIIG